MPEGTSYGDLNSQVKEAQNTATTRQQSRFRPRRRSASAAVNLLTTDAEGSDVDSEECNRQIDEYGEDRQETGSSGLPVRSKRRRASSAVLSDRQTKPERKNTYMKGRFSGRLPTKDDERKLADECQLMAPLLSEDGSLCTLPTIIRAMATGSVRAFLEQQKEAFDSAKAKLDVLNSIPEGSSIMTLTEKVVRLQTECGQLRRLLAIRDEQLAEAGLSPRGMVVLEAGQVDGLQPSAHAQLAPSAVAATEQFPSATGLQHVESQLQFAQPSSLPVNQSISVNVNPALVSAPIVSTIPDPQHQMPVSMQQLVMTTTVPVSVTVPSSQLQAVAPTSVLCTVPSSGSLLQPNSTAAVQQVVQQEHLAPSLPTHPPAQEDSTVSATAVAASNLNEHAHQLAVTAKLHEVAKTEASVQAQQLAATAQQHAQASVQAAQQAEELKKTLAVLPDSHQAQQAAATVQDLEARAQVHASITTQVVAQARGMHEKAQAHEKEQLKAITQASMLQAHAQSLHASSQMEMPQQPLNPSQSHHSLISSAPNGHAAGGVSNVFHAVTTQERPTTPHFGASANASNVVTSGDPFGAGLVAPPLTLTRSDIEGGGLHQVAVVTQPGANIVQCDQPFEATQHLQQQFAVIQAPQHVGTVPMSQMVGIQQPPVTIQVLPTAQAQTASQQQWSHQSGTPREGTAGVLMHCGSSTIAPMDQNSLPLTDGEGTLPPLMDNGINGGMVNGHSTHEQQESQQQGFLTANIHGVNVATDDIHEQLPSLQPLTSDPKLASLTATMEPVIEIPQVSYQPLPGIAYDEAHKDMAKNPAVLPVSSPALPSVSAGL